MLYVRYMEFKDRLRKAREESNLTQAQLAELCGLTQAAIQSLESGRVKSTTHLLKIAKKLHKSPDWLQSGKMPESSVNINEKLTNFQKVPHIGWHDIDRFIKACLNGEDTSQISHKEIVIVLSDEQKLEKDCFALTVTGDAMVPKESDRNTLYDGDKVIVDPHRSPTSNKIVLFRTIADNAHTLRQYMQDGDKFFLRALNKDYPKIPITDDIKIIGTVIYTIREN